MKLYTKALALLALLVVGLAAVTFAGAIAVYYYVAPSLPDVETLRDVKLQVPLRVYTRDGRLIAEFGEHRRTPMRFEDIPEPVVQAFLAAEDDRFFRHPGVDYQGLTRAIVSLMLTGERRQGGGTITMQLARNFFLSREKTYVRKLREIFLALRIENELTKIEILTLYLNKIFLGQRSYGVAAAAEVYYGKTLDALNLAEIATIAGLPKAPSRDNPVTSPSRARARRAYVLRRMHELRFIDDTQYEEAMLLPAPASLHGPTVQVHAPYLAEMVRVDTLNRFGRSAYTDGYQVITTLDSRLQRSATRALRQALLEYDRRHGYRGHVASVEWPMEGEDLAWATLLEQYPESRVLRTGLVTAVEERSAQVYLRDGQAVTLHWTGIAWARPYIDEDNVGPKPEQASDVLSAGSIIRLIRLEDGNWQLAQLPDVQGALVALDPRDGAIVSLSGGFDYYVSKYNRVTQAHRQPGSSFKPFIYSAALEQGFTAASIVNDAPVVFQDSALESTWRPENYSGRFYGPTRLREALIRSRNMVSIRVLQSVGIGNAIRHLANFGFPSNMLPRDLSLALGSVAITPLKLATGYTVFANGGYLTEPYYVQRILGANRELSYEADPLIACEQCEPSELAPTSETTTEIESEFVLRKDEGEIAAEVEQTSSDGSLETTLDVGQGSMGFDLVRNAPRVLSEQNAYLIGDLMRDVVRRGTGRRAYRELRRNDLAGKTGTTNDRRDAWFSGFNGDLVATAWVGFDQERSLGRREEGGRTALPMWIYFMREALAIAPERRLSQPPGLITVRISPETGLLASAGDPDAMFEIFRVETVPEVGTGPAQPSYVDDGEEEEDEPLF